MKQKRRNLSDEISAKLAAEFIINDKVGPGELLPSERSLSEHFGVSKVTIRAAIRTLMENGLVSVRNGVGTTVLPRVHEVTHGLDRLASIDTFARQQSSDVQTDLLDWSHAPADAEASRKLRIPVGDPTLKVSRRKILNGVPAAWIVDVAPLHGVDEDQLRKDFQGSVLDVMLESDTYQPEYADSEVRPCLVDAGLDQVLPDVTDGLLLHMDTIVMSREGTPLLWGLVWMDPNQFRFAFSRRRFAG